MVFLVIGLLLTWIWFSASFDSRTWGCVVGWEDKVVNLVLAAGLAYLPVFCLSEATERVVLETETVTVSWFGQLVSRSSPKDHRLSITTHRRVAQGRGPCEGLTFTVRWRRFSVGDAMVNYDQLSLRLRAL